MVNKQTPKFYKESKSIKIPEIKKEFEEEFNELSSIGVKQEEIEYLVNLKIREKLTLEITKN